MSTVYVGSARIGDRGLGRGGAAGDQKGGEVATQPWYKHEKGWVVIRAKDPAMRPKIAAAMKAACDNNNIGYDMSQRDTLYNLVKPLGFDPAKANKPCETDCSALVRVCVAFAGFAAVPNFHTNVEPATLEKTGRFDVLTDPALTDHPDKLLAGDILCTKTSGHTVIVLNDGEHAYDTDEPKPEIPYTIQNGSKGDVVKKLQTALNARGAKPALKVDGYFGDITDAAVCAYQKANHLVVDGVVGPKTWTALLK